MNIESLYQEVFNCNINEHLEPQQVDLKMDQLNKLSKAVQSIAIQAIEKHLGESWKESVAIVTTGSDGRFEKTGIASPMELIVITNDASAKSEQIASQIRSIFKENLDKKLFYHKFEWKSITGKQTTGLVSDFVGEKAIKTIPTRPLDAQFLYGNKALYTQYRKTLVDELLNRDCKLVDFHKKTVKFSLKTLSQDLLDQEPLQDKSLSEKLFNNHGRFMDIKQGLLNFNGEDCKGPKYGPMHSIQYSVAHAILKPLYTADEKALNQSKAKKFDRQAYANEMLNTLPPETAGRIDWLQKKDIIKLTPQESVSLQTCYKTLLLWYAHLQAKYDAVNASVSKNSANNSDSLVEKVDNNQKQEVQAAKIQVTAQVPPDQLKSILEITQKLLKKF